MAVNKKVQIDFADSSIKAIDHIQDIRRAVENASLNLNMRYNVVLQYPMPENGRVVLEIRIPDEMVESFSYGKRLRGISNFLLNSCGGRYQQHQVGNRLLTYTLLDDDGKPDQHEQTGPAMVDRLEAISAFAKLLERSDEEALDQIGRILMILKEARQPWDG